MQSLMCLTGGKQMLSNLWTSPAVIEKLEQLEQAFEYVYFDKFLRWDKNRMNLNDVSADTVYEYRYEERGMDYNLKRWNEGNTSSSNGLVSDRDPWLVNIIDTAKIGGHAHRIKQPPPDLIVWFKTDSKRNLINFIEME